MRISDWSSDVCSSDLLAALVPLIFHARDRAGLDAGTALKPLGRDAGQGRAAHLIAGALPFVARHAQHGRFAGASIADDDCQVVLAGDMRQGVLLLASQRKASTLGGVSPPHLRRRRETMPRPIRTPIAGLAQPLLGVHLVARREPTLAEIGTASGRARVVTCV